MANTGRKNKHITPLKKALFALVASGFLAGLFALGAIWMQVSQSNSLITIVLVFVSVMCLLISFRVYASISLNLAQNDQKHLQNALTQAKDMLDTNKELRDDHVLLQSLLQNLPHPVWLKDRFGRYLVANQIFIQQWCDGQDAKGKTDDELLNKTLADTFANADQQAMTTGVPQKLELRLDIQGQAPRWVRIERYALRGEDQQAVGVLGFAIDISHYKDNVSSTDAAYTDPITLLNNHAALMAKLALDEELEKEIICLHIDIDHFRVMNDSLGSSSGNQILIKIAERLISASESNDFIARISADEFIVVWLYDNQENIQQRIEKLHQSVNQPVSIGDSQYSFTTSVGAAKSPNHGTSFSEVLRKSGVALFNAKKHGRNQVHWYSETYNNQATRRLNKEQLLRQAVNNQQFQVHVQPRIDCGTGEIEALECLVRIQADDGELIYPGGFIDLAEQNGLIKDIDRFMLKTAFTQIHTWLEQGQQPLLLAVNLSMLSINDDLETLLQEWREKNSDVFNFIEIELTEHRLPENDSQFLEQLHRIGRYGIRLALDDFGTGYANISRLPDWPFQILKLDRSFMVGLLASSKQQTVVKSVIDLCQALGIKVVAEGVEKEEELTLIDQLGCHSIQGFVYAQPKPLNDIENWLVERKLTAQ